MTNLLTLKEVTDQELYVLEGIIAILSQYHHLVEEALTDAKLREAKADIDTALRSNALDGNMRMALACTYVFELNVVQGSQLAGLKLKDFKEALDEAHETIEAVLNGYKSTKLTIRASQAEDYDNYLKEVADGSINMFDVTEQVNYSLIHFLAKKGDSLSKKMLGHTVKETHVATEFVEEEDGTPEYPFYQTSQAIESPTRNANFVDWKVSGYDYFKVQDKNRKVMSYDDLSVLDYRGSKDGNRKKRTTDRKGENN